MALESLGGCCVGHAEIDPKPHHTYQLFFGDEEKNWGDLMAINPAELPDFDLMVAGFPCQTFSIVGKRDGMQDARGQIIHGLCSILKHKKTPFFLLENVKGLVNHQGGDTLKEVLRLLDDTGYRVEHRVLKSTDFGIPQIRERIFFLGVRKDLDHDIQFPEPIVPSYQLKDYLCDQDPKHIFDFDSKAGQTFTTYLANKYNQGHHDIDALMQHDHLVIDTRQSDLRQFNNCIPTLRTGRHGIFYVRNKQLRRLSGYEALLLQGIPHHIAIKASSVPTTNLLSQAGNAMTVNVIKALGKTFLPKP